MSVLICIYPVRIFCQDFTRHNRLRCPTSYKSHKGLAFWWPHLPLHLPPRSCTWFLKELGPSSCRCARSRFCLAFLRSNWASTRQGLFQVVPCSGLFRPFKQRVLRELKWTGSTGMYGLVSFIESTLPFSVLMMFVVKAGFMALLPKSPPPAVHCKGVNDAPKKTRDSMMTLQMPLARASHDFLDRFGIWFSAPACVTFFLDLQLQPTMLQHELPQVLIIDDPQCWNQFPGDIHLHKFSLFDIAVAPSTVIFSRVLLPMTFCTAAVHHCTIEQVCLPRQFRKPWKEVRKCKHHSSDLGKHKKAMRLYDTEEAGSRIRLQF